MLLFLSKLECNLHFMLDVWDKLYKQVCRAFGPILAASLAPLAQRQIRPVLVCFTLKDNHLNWLNLFLFLNLVRGPSSC